MTTYPGNDNNPTWSPDGSKIVFYSTRNGSAEIWVVSAEGGEPWQVTDDPTANAQIPLWSPDGRWLVFLSETARAGRMWRVSAEDGTAEPLTQRSGHGACWSPDGSQLYYTGNAGLWALSMDDGTEYPLMDLTGRPGELGRLTLDTDGEFLYFTWKEDLGDIWVMDVVTDS